MRNMNKLMVIAAFVLVVNVTFGQESDKDWKKTMPLDNGAHLLFTASSLSDMQFDETKSLLGLDWGNTFNVYKLDGVDLALGIRVSWIDVNFRSQTIDLGFGSEELTNYTAIASFFGIGPNVTYKVQEKIGVEAYFKVKPVLYVNWSETSDDLSTSDVSEAGFGTTNAFGIAGRYDVFTLGVEFGGGTITTTQTTDTALDSIEVDFDRPLAYTRFFIGFRF